MVGAALSILAYLIAPPIIRAYGNYSTAIALVILQIFIFYGLISSTSPLALAALFAAQTAIVALISLTLDIFLEVYTDGHHVGRIRGFYTSILNACFVLGPIIGALLINGTNDYRSTYIASLAMLFPLLYLIYRNFPRFKDPHYSHPSPWQLIKRISHHPDWIRILTINRNIRR